MKPVKAALHTLRQAAKVLHKSALTDEALFR